MNTTFCMLLCLSFCISTIETQVEIHQPKVHSETKFYNILVNWLEFAILDPRIFESESIWPNMAEVEITKFKIAIQYVGPTIFKEYELQLISKQIH